jgi:aryl-alcohol dehydrogenase-like predicted oxidoreductase
LFTERNWRIVEEVKRVAAEAGSSPARVALAWVAARPGVASTLMGVSRVEQVADNAAALALRLSPEHLAALDEASGDRMQMLYGLSRPPFRDRVVFGGAGVRGWNG